MYVNEKQINIKYKVIYTFFRIRTNGQFIKHLMKYLIAFLWVLYVFLMFDGVMRRCSGRMLLSL